MATDDQKACTPQAGKALVQKAKQAAADRLSKALRINLYRRKAQARARKSRDPTIDETDQKNKDDS